MRGVDAEVDGLPVVAAASHDTASAVAGVPLRPDRRGIYISCGTWSLVGCELAGPDHARARRWPPTSPTSWASSGTVRLLKNVTGLWLLEECRRTWAAQGRPDRRGRARRRRRRVPGGRSVIDPDDPRFAAPGDMPARIGEYCRETGQPVPASPAEVTRTILDSLALTWRTTVATIERVAGFEAEVIHLVGGGSSIPLLRELCASACGRPVLAGPAEATVVGNAIVQAIAGGALADLAEGRALVERAARPRRGRPTPHPRLARPRRPALANASVLSASDCRCAAHLKQTVRFGGDRGGADDELGSEHHLLVDVVGTCRALGQQQVGGRAAEQLDAADAPS